MILVAFAAISRTVGHLSKSAEVMKLVNNLMKAPEMAVAMQEFSKEMTKVYFCITLFPFRSYIS
jgi:charged multivesicular body protein 3